MMVNQPERLPPPAGSGRWPPAQAGGMKGRSGRFGGQGGRDDGNAYGSQCPLAIQPAVWWRDCSCRVSFADGKNGRRRIMGKGLVIWECRRSCQSLSLSEAVGQALAPPKLDNRRPCPRRVREWPN